MAHHQQGTGRQPFPEGLTALAEEMAARLPPGTVLPCMDPNHDDECEARRVAGYLVLPVDALIEQEG